MRSRSLVVQWGCSDISSTEGSRNDKVAEEDGEGRSPVRRVCNALVIKVGHGGLNMLWLHMVTGCWGTAAGGVSKEATEFNGNVYGGEEKGVGGENAA